MEERGEVTNSVQKRGETWGRVKIACRSVQGEEAPEQRAVACRSVQERAGACRSVQKRENVSKQRVGVWKSVGKRQRSV